MDVRNFFHAVATATFWIANGFMAMWCVSALLHIEPGNSAAMTVLFVLMIMLPLWAAVMVITGGFLMLAKKARCYNAPVSEDGVNVGCVR